MNDPKTDSIHTMNPCPLCHREDLTRDEAWAMVGKQRDLNVARDMLKHFTPIWSKK